MILSNESFALRLFISERIWKDGLAFQIDLFLIIGYGKKSKKGKTEYM